MNNNPTCRSGVINTNIITKIKSSLAQPSQDQPQIHQDEFECSKHYKSNKQLVCKEAKPSISALKTAYSSKYRSMFFNKRYMEQGKCAKDGLINMTHTKSSNLIKTHLKISPNGGIANMKTVIKVKESNGANRATSNRTKMNNNLNNDLYLSNYNINAYISRTDTSRLLIREQIKLRKEHCTQPSLSLGLISKKTKHYLFKSFNEHENNNKYNITELRNNKLYYEARSLFFRNQRKKRKKNCVIDIKDIPRYQHHHHMKEKKYNDDNHNALKDNKNEKDKDSDRKDADDSNDLFKVIKKINHNQMNEMNINQKDVFKKLRGDIQKSECKIKNILEDLRRTQTLNDEGLKRKGFIMKVGCITGEYFK